VTWPGLAGPGHHVTSYRDLAQADAFHRQRLVTAFISGDQPGARGQAPRAGRCLLGGVALLVVLAAGAGVSSAVTGHPVLSWDNGAVRVSP
jgi:hypothetical protein